jgi:hypothetical protein
MSNLHLDVQRLMINNKLLHGDEKVREKTFDQDLKNKAFERQYEDESDFDELDILEEQLKKSF